MNTLPAGSIIGILGGGQLGRMIAMAAARLGFRCHIYCSDPNEPALQVSAFHTVAAFDDEEALTRFAKSVSVVTLEWENVPLAAIDTIAAHVAVYPGASVLRVAQDRGLEKRFAREAGIGTAEFKLIHSLQELETTLETFPLPAILKSTRMGYDGKGQAKIQSRNDAAAAWRDMGSDEGILEAFVPFEREVSVIVARSQDGAVVAYPVCENVHRNHILAETTVPAAIDNKTSQEAIGIASRLATQLHVVGLLAVEMFVLKEPNEKGQRVLMNEIAPRPHNSGHWTIDACSCSQYEMLVRAVCGLPLGNTTPHSKSQMINILGEDLGKCQGYVADPNACLHLYGKSEARTGRKMGHVTILKGSWSEC